MKRCDERAYSQCPDHERCGPIDHAWFVEGSECDKYNEDVQDRTAEKKKG